VRKIGTRRKDSKKSVIRKKRFPKEKQKNISLEVLWQRSSEERKENKKQKKKEKKKKRK
jgi:hypothetical protein